MPAELIVAETAGFCFGVQRAADLVFSCLDAGEPVCTLGPLIHNRQFVEELAARGVVVVGSPSEDADKRRIVIRSHGVAQSVYDEMDALGIPYTDATCPFVRKIHRIAASVPEDGMLVVVGDETHPEVQGIVGHCRGEVRVVSSPEEISAIPNEYFARKSSLFFEIGRAHV